MVTLTAILVSKHIKCSPQHQQSCSLIKEALAYVQIPEATLTSPSQNLYLTAKLFIYSDVMEGEENKLLMSKHVPIPLVKFTTKKNEKMPSPVTMILTTLSAAAPDRMTEEAKKGELFTPLKLLRSSLSYSLKKSRQRFKRIF